ncbi:PEP-CTERM sorting domain-containing protein [Massilia sp. CCM 8733]|uniref:PEP-CTERM sorting domain-containing protein n=1 Tax=Massilia mucilaginosa TaxID=2609282 RepID=A0ABX0NYC5_9BURK|nr:PEP-CTERM sorting domain-containing protein [Massilia mucilaginosa]NHZ92004.1 PEP-CTERM sorting domain-containing protein [Massilia mucilaginosa]
MSKQPSRLPARLFLAGLLLSPLAAHALTATSSVQVRQLSIEVIDLRPDDGVAPVVEFGRPYVTSRVAYSVDLEANDPFLQYGYGALEHTWTVGAAQTSTEPTALTASTVYHGPALSNRSIHAGNTYGVSFSLSPHTAVRFSAAVDLTASPPDATALASSVAIFSGQLEEERFIYSSFNSYYSSVDNGTGTNLFSRTLQTGEHRGTGGFTFWANAYAGIYGVPSMPEPATYAMLLAGLGLVLWRRRGAASADAYGPTYAGRLPLTGRTRA